MQKQITDLLAMRKGHFLLESGHHGELWLDLELLCWNPIRLKPIVTELTKRISKYNVEMICSPLVEGAFVGLMAALELNLEFVYTERFIPSNGDNLFPAEYRLPEVLHEKIRGKRVAVINDVINAGSAVRGTFSELHAYSANPVCVGTLMMLGDVFVEYAENNKIAIETLAMQPNPIWKPKECPLCVSDVPLEGVGGFQL